MWQIWDILGRLSAARHLLDGMAQWSLEADTASFNALIVGSDGSRLVRKEKEWGTAEPGGTRRNWGTDSQLFWNLESERFGKGLGPSLFGMDGIPPSQKRWFRAPMNADYAVSCGNPLGNGVRVVDEYFRPFDLSCNSCSLNFRPSWISQYISKEF